ncbi:hypothetical protein AMATHDRAFT_2873 [Amanita thiersii Skay4041]|uniref:Uncharacterized protein n=1 Tax=Amanita thiersii Skay4041 TaxID=703135 RepID=A0A2A9NQJ8_9AGAR|nr:hypothetical protein AMATHDRAFT_2873 [Amanita thiersii Skay4041]
MADLGVKITMIVLMQFMVVFICLANVDTNYHATESYALNLFSLYQTAEEQKPTEDELTMGAIGSPFTSRRWVAFLLLVMGLCLITASLLIHSPAMRSFFRKRRIRTRTRDQLHTDELALIEWAYEEDDIDSWVNESNEGIPLKSPQKRYVL